MLITNCQICDMEFSAPQKKCNICTDCKNKHIAVYRFKNRINYLLNHGVRKNQKFAKINKLDLPVVCKKCSNCFWRINIKSVLCWRCVHKNKCRNCHNTIHIKANYCNKYCYQKNIKGMSYEKRFGTNDVGCGFKKGRLNPNTTRKHFIQTNLKRTNSRNEHFRSNLEIEFSEILHDLNIIYEYERRVFYQDNEKERVKLIDFCVGDVWIEISGLWHENWKQDFLHKVCCMRKCHSNPLIIITPDETYHKTSKYF